MTESEKRKIDMKELWKETFHDSDRYIDLVFDTYFSLDNSFVRYHENRIIAALLCVHYEFQILTKEGDKRLLRGMYLCGLATRPEWRRRGVMADLMKEAEDDIKARGYDLVFLIPADDHLREYYKRKGYRNASWRIRKQILRDDNCICGGKAMLNIYTVKKFTEGRVCFLSQLADWCRNIELSRKFNTIVHSHEDFITILVENENSIFLTDSTFDPEFPNLAKVHAIAFPELSEEHNDRMSIVGLYGLSEEIEDGSEESAHTHEILTAIMSWFNRSELETILPEKGIELRDMESRAEPYAMVKTLQMQPIPNTDNNDDLKFEISLMLD